MKRNWYAAIILLALCVLLFRAGQYVDRTTAGMQRQLEAAYALAEQGDYPAARRAYRAVRPTGHCAALKSWACLCAAIFWISSTRR